MLHRLFQADLPIACHPGDTVYGSTPALRTDLEDCLQAYALAVPCKGYVDVQGTRTRVDHVARALAREEWQVVSAGAGSNEPRLFAWAHVELAAPEANGWQRWSLVRRSMEEGVKPAEMVYILVFAPAGTSLVDMVGAFASAVLPSAHVTPQRCLHQPVMCEKLSMLLGQTFSESACCDLPSCNPAKTC